MKKYLSLIICLCVIISAPIFSHADSPTLIFPSSLQTIAPEAFMGTTSVNTVIANHGLISIGSKAFANSSVTHVDLPYTVNSIADDAFEGCRNVTFLTHNHYCYDWATSHGFQATFETGVGRTVLKVAFNQTISNPEAQTLQRISDDLYAATEGRYSLEIYPDASLGDQAQTLEMVMRGALDMALVGNAIIEPYCSDFALLSTPYIYNSFAHQERVFESGASELLDLYQETETHGFTVLSSYCIGARNIYTRNSPVTSPEQMSGLKIRTIGTDTCINMIKAMGGIGVAMPQGDVYSAIQTGVIDGADNNIITYVDLVQYEVAPYYNCTGHLMLPDHLVISNSTIEQMSSADRAVLEHVCQDSISYCYDRVEELNETYRARAEELGATITDADVGAFQQSCGDLIQAAAGRTSVTQNLYYLIQALGDESNYSHVHHFSEWDGEQTNTCTDPVVQTRTCSECGYKQTRTIKGSHNFSDWQLTETTNTYREYIRTCSVCEQKETKREKINHNGQTVLKVAFNQSITNPEAQTLQRISDDLYTATEGRYSLEIYPDASLGDQTQTLKMVTTGTLDMAVVGNAIIESYCPDFAILGAPYVFSSLNHMQNVLNSDAVDSLFHEAVNHGFTVLAGYCSGARNIYSRDKAITNPAGLTGQKIRVMGTDTYLNMINAMGGTGVGMPMGDVYSAIQVKVIDGSENTLTTYHDLVQYEVAPYYNLTRHLMIPDELVISNTVLNSMSEADKAALVKACRESISYCFELVEDMETATIARLEDLGVTIVQTDTDAFRSRCQTLTESIANQSDQSRSVYYQIQALKDI